MKKNDFFHIGMFNEEAYYQEDNDFRIRMGELKIPKLVSKKIIYYNNIGDRFKDFKRQCANTSKSFMVYPFKSIGVLIQIFMIFLTFPFLYLVLFFALFWRTGDIFVSFTSPLIWIMRRILEIYYLVGLLLL